MAPIVTDPVVPLSKVATIKEARDFAAAGYIVCDKRGWAEASALYEEAYNGTDWSTEGGMWMGDMPVVMDLLKSASLVADAARRAGGETTAAPTALVKGSSSTDRVPDYPAAAADRLSV